MGISASCQLLSWAGNSREMSAFADSALLNPREAVFMSLLKTRLHSFWHLFMNALVYSANASLSLLILSTALERFTCLHVSELSLDLREKNEVMQVHIRKVL